MESTDTDGPATQTMSQEGHSPPQNISLPSGKMQVCAPTGKAGQMPIVIISRDSWSSGYFMFSEARTGTRWHQCTDRDTHGTTRVGSTSQLAGRRDQTVSSMSLRMGISRYRPKLGTWGRGNSDASALAFSRPKVKTSSCLRTHMQPAVSRWRPLPVWGRLNLVLEIWGLQTHPQLYVHPKL